MHSWFAKFWRDERGSAAAEWMLVASILTLSALAGLAAMYRAGW